MHALRAAESDALRAAEAGRVTVRELSSLEECLAAEEVCNQVFVPAAGTAAVTVEWMRVLAKTGNYVAGAYDGDQLIAMAVGLRTGERGESLHSHVAAVVGGQAGRGVGFALKLHQRAWAVHKEMPFITWTFDPLVRRNAHLNLVKLGAQPVEYLQNFYGSLQDARNGGDETDRLLVQWSLLDEGVSAVCGRRRRTSEPVPAEVELILEIDDQGGPRARPAVGELLGVTIPADIEALRRERPDLAREWRHAVRDTLGVALGDGARYEGFRSVGLHVLSQRDRS
jgi:predicted GNAT superfamily acetyltransferase